MDLDLRAVVFLFSRFMFFFIFSSRLRDCLAPSTLRKHACQEFEKSVPSSRLWATRSRQAREPAVRTRSVPLRGSRRYFL